MLCRQTLRQWPASCLLVARRGWADSKPGADEGEVADLLNSHVAPGGKRDESAPRVLTTRREALSLYRQILRYSNLFVWRDERGRTWRDVIRASARQEFEAARFEPDPELVGRMLVTGRDAVERTVERFLRKRDQIHREELDEPTPR